MRNLETETDIRIDKLFNAFQKYVLNSLWKIPNDLDVRPEYLNVFTGSIKDSSNSKTLSDIYS